ncbi:MAG: acyl-CoA dehydrogenase family protein [Alphaproteobacteria bacterium]
MTYQAPLKDIRHTLDNIIGLRPLMDTGAFPDLSDDLVGAILEESGKLSSEVLAPLNWTGDVQGSKLNPDHTVTLPDGFGDAYRTWVEAGWGSVPFDPGYGGQGLPRLIMLAVQEMVQAANPAWGLGPLLTQGAIEALHAHGTQEQKSLFLPKLISGEWSGTMNLTEPHAGSDVGALRAKAERRGDGTYAITGTKIWISWGEHPAAENIVHLVLARLPEAPPGTRGLSLFLVPKVLVEKDGSLGARNDVKCIGLEGKLGIHGSPTCVMSYGENGGAIGTLIGRENKGMAAMFTMMNNARLNVGIQGVGLSDAAFQKALAYAKDRRQGKPFGLQHELIDMIPIIQHADVRRMLLLMKAQTEAARAICYATAQAADLALSHPNETQRATHKAREELLTPIAKAFSTDLGVENASIGVQVHGGAGFVEETGAAQYLRDSRIYPIYEGTNGIQAIDLVTRKLPLEGGLVLERLMDEVRATAHALTATEDPALGHLVHGLKVGVSTVEQVSEHHMAALRDKPSDALAGATPFLRLMGTVLGGHYLGRGALAARHKILDGDTDTAFWGSKMTLAKFYASAVLPLAPALGQTALGGSDVLYEADPDVLTG